MRARSISPQLAIVWLALVLAALSGTASFAGLIAAYATAWLVVNVAVARGIALPALDTPSTRRIGALIIAAPVVAVGAQLRAIAEHEGLLGLEAHLADRARLERDPALHPDLVATDRPQLFLLRASGATRARVTLAPGMRAIDAEPLGHGVFRVDYDPRRDGVPSVRGRTEARIELDGREHAREIEVIAPLAHPRWLRASPDRTRACITSEETDELVVIDASGLVARIETGDAPSDCGWAGDRVVVVHRHARDLAVIDPGSGTRERVPVSAWAHRVAVHANGERVAIAHEDGAIAVIDLARRAVVAEHRAGGLADWIEWDRDALIVARRAPAALLRIAEGRTERALAAPAVTMARTADAIVIAATDWSESPEPHLGNHYVQDQLVEFDPRTLAPRRVIPTAHRSPRQDAAGGLDRGLSPMHVDASDREWLIAFAGSDEVWWLDPARGLAPRAIDVAGLGLGAPMSAVSLAGGAIAVSSAAGGRIAILDRGGAMRAAIALAPDDRALLRDDADALRRRFGERAFYEGTRAGVSCQSCHLHGASDGLRHNIGGQTLAPTLDVRGVRGTAPYLRDGSYPRLGDLHEVATELYRGYREPAGDRAATLEAWLASLPPPLSFARRDPARERRGLDVFVRAECARCHALPATTGLGRHPIASVFPAARAPDALSLDAPSLRATSRRARWLHDGRATSLDAIFDRENAGDRHGRTRALSAGERGALRAFLESL